MASKDHSLFGAVIENISSDKFLLFMDRFTLKYILHPIQPDVEEDSKTCSSTQLDWIVIGKPDAPYTPKHHEVFSLYCRLFESRLNSILRQHKISEERFTQSCQEQLQSATVNTQTVSNEEATTADLCRSLLDIVGTVGDFNAFALMMRDKQAELWKEDDDTDEEEEREEKH